MKALSIIETAYRATIEEQDDTVIWLMQALKQAEASLDVVLRGSAVNYAVHGQDARGLVLGGWHQTEPPSIEQQLADLIQQGSLVYAVVEDLAVHGLSLARLTRGVEPIRLRALAELMPNYERVWHW